MYLNSFLLDKIGSFHLEKKAFTVYMLVTLLVSFSCSTALMIVGTVPFWDSVILISLICAFTVLSVGMSINLMLRKVVIELELLIDQKMTFRLVVTEIVLLTLFWIGFSYIHNDLLVKPMTSGALYYFQGYVIFGFITIIEQVTFLSCLQVYKTLHLIEVSKAKYRKSVIVILTAFFIKLSILVIFFIIPVALQK
ncbi:MAG: hypothetical protein ACPGO5_01390 [Patescibacteria group bacterium]